MKTHTLKCRMQYFVELCEGRKTFEIRKNDRGFQVGDLLELVAVSDNDKPLSGAFNQPLPLLYKVTYMTDFAQQDGYVVLALADAHDAMAKDAARLDWIESQWTNGVHIEVCAIGKCSGDVLEKQATVFTRSGDHKSGTVRGAIDAAMGADNG